MAAGGDGRDGSDAAGADPAALLRARLAKVKAKQRAEAAEDEDIEGGEEDGEEDGTGSRFQSLARLAAACGLNPAELTAILERKKAAGQGSALAWARAYRQRLAAQSASLEKLLLAREAELSRSDTDATQEAMREEIARFSKELERLRATLGALRAWEDEERERRRKVLEENKAAQAARAEEAKREEEEKRRKLGAAREQEKSKRDKRKEEAAAKARAEAEALRVRLQQEREAAAAAAAKEKERRGAGARRR